MIKCYTAIRRLQYSAVELFVIVITQMMFALQYDPCFSERVSFVSLYFAITFRTWVYDVG
jgi:hypothetical protein